AAICIADAHQDLCRGMARRLQQDDLIASDAGPPIRQPAYGCGAERDRTATKVKHDKIVAEPMHFVKRDLAHAAALYGGGDGSVQRCRDPAPDGPCCRSVHRIMRHTKARMSSARLGGLRARRSDRFAAVSARAVSAGSLGGGVSAVPPAVGMGRAGALE